MSRELTELEVKEVTSIKDENITKELFIMWFGRDAKTGKAKFEPNDYFQLKKGMIENYTESQPMKTTVGRFIWNRYLSESIFGKRFKYFNSEKWNAFDMEIVDSYLLGKITPEQSAMYQTKKAWLLYTNVEVLVPGLSFNILSVNPKVESRKKELVKKYSKELDKGDVVIAKLIEDELLSLAKEENKHDPALRLYTPGKPSWGNNYKNMCVMVGAQKDNDGDGFKIATTSYEEGIPKNEYDSFADQLIGGTYARSVATAKAGYMVKKTQSALQNETCNQNIDSDCGTTLTDTVTIPTGDKESRLYHFRFIKEGNKLIELTPDVIGKYKGKSVQLRTITNCKGKSYCAKCAGTYFARLGIKNVGLTCSDAPSTMLVASMKAFHDASIKVYDMKFEDWFKDY